MSVTVRRATAEDLPFCLELAPRLAAVARLPWRGPEEVDEFQESFMRAALETPAAGSATLMAVDETGRRLGFIHAEPALDAISGAPSGYIPLLAVAAAYEGRGVAQALMAAVESFAAAAGWRFVSLDVFFNNERGRAFYEGQGFLPETLRLFKPVRHACDEARGESLSGAPGSPPSG